MCIYLHLLGGEAQPDADMPSHIHTLGPLDAMAEFQDGNVRLNFLPDDTDNPIKAELEKRSDPDPGKKGYFLKRDSDGFMYADTRFHSYHISDQAELSDDNILILQFCYDNFRRILTMVPWLDQLLDGDAVLLAAPQSSDLHVDLYARDLCHIDVALTHYTQDANGKRTVEVAMTVRLYQNRRLAFPIDCQVGDEYRIALEPEDARLNNPKEHARQSVFLNQWLRDLAKRGHIISTQQGAKK